MNRVCCDKLFVDGWLYLQIEFVRQADTPQLPCSILTWQWQKSTMICRCIFLRCIISIVMLGSLAGQRRKALRSRSGTWPYDPKLRSESFPNSRNGYRDTGIPWNSKIESIVNFTVSFYAAGKFAKTKDVDRSHVSKFHLSSFSLRASFCQCCF